jgi:hypothetical protein
MNCIQNDSFKICNKYLVFILVLFLLIFFMLCLFDFIFFKKVLNKLLMTLPTD